MKFKYLVNRSDFCFNFDSSYFKRLDSILKKYMQINYTH